MNRVGARLDGHVDLRSRPPTVFRLGIFDHAKFLNGVGRQQHRLFGTAGRIAGVDGDGGVVGLLIGDAIEHVYVVLRAQAIRVLRRAGGGALPQLEATGASPAAERNCGRR